MEQQVTGARIEPVLMGGLGGADPASTFFARSSTYQKLREEILNYTLSHTGGGSILLSGHRGAGKTTLVNRAIEDLVDYLANSKITCRPLIIPLHGPDLVEISRSADRMNATSTANEPATLDKAAAPPIIQLSLDELKIKNVLENLTISLYRSLANEFHRSFREQLEQNGRLAELKELVGLLRLELDENTDVSTLREIWQQAGLLESGALFSNRSPDQGVQEIVLLSSAAQAFRIVAGVLSKTEESSLAREAEKITSLEYKFESKDLVNAVFGLASGAAVGAGINAAITGPYHLLAGAIGGIVTALIANFTFNYSSKRTITKKQSKQYKFIRYTDIASLNRELPNLITRIRGIGLAPIFVVDELDKVVTPDVFKEFGDLIGYLKKLVSDSAFFCFLTDRNYFDFISNLYRTNLYPREYTYFTHRFYVNYTPRDLHLYLDGLFGMQGIQDVLTKADALLLQYLMLNRANLHAIDLRREILRRVEVEKLRTEGIRSKRGYRFPIMIQLAIETILDQPELWECVDQDPYFSQMINDTLYYPLRSWLAGEKMLDISKGKLLRYIVVRAEFGVSLPAMDALIKENKWEEIEQLVPISNNDLDFLCGKLQELAALLTDYTALRKVLDRPEKQKWIKDTYILDGLWNIILNTIPRELTNRKSNLALLGKIDQSNTSFE